MLETNFVMNIMEDLLKQEENIILEQLNELISRELLVVQRGQPQLFQDYNSNKITLSHSIKLVLKDQEYIEELETENKDLKNRLNSINEAINAGPSNIRKE